METNYCLKCGQCCRRIAVDFSKNIIYRDGIQELTKDFAKMLKPIHKKENITFCECEYLATNHCINPNKPDICKNFPSSPFAFLPENCGYEGLIFTKLEHEKQKIRKLKEDIIEYESRLDTDRNLIKIITRHKAYIEKFKHYGSEDW